MNDEDLDWYDDVLIRIKMRVDMIDLDNPECVGFRENENEYKHLRNAMGLLRLARTEVEIRGEAKTNSSSQENSG